MLFEEGILLELQEGEKACAFDMNPFYCIDCAETHEAAPILVGPYQICESGFRDRIVPQFEKALKNEAEHPVKVNNIALDINNYTAFFSREFLSEWRTKQLEYTTPAQQRLYCRCGEFLGRRKLLEDAHVFLHCRDCRAITCSSCGKAISELRHHCTTSEKIEDAFANLKRGDDYQLCPNETCGLCAPLGPLSRAFPSLCNSLRDSLPPPSRACTSRLHSPLLSGYRGRRPSQTSPPPSLPLATAPPQ